MFGLSIKAKLLAIFATILLLVGVQSWLALSNLNGLEDSLVFTHKDLLPSVVAAKDMQTSWSAMQLAEAEYVMAKTTDTRNSAESQLRVAESAWKKNSEFYKDLIEPVHVEEAERFAKIERAFDAYKTQIAQIAELISSGKSDEAAASFSEKIAGPFHENLALIQTLVDTNDGELKTTLEETDRSSKTALQQTLGGASATLLICVFAMVFSQIGIGSPLKTIAERVRRLAGGDLGGEIRYRGRKDELGAIANAVEIFRESAIEKERLTRIATQEAGTQAQRRAALEGLIGTFEEKARGILDSFASAALEMSNTAEILSATAVETSDRGASVAAASEEASANVRSVATAARQLGASVDEISRQAGQSSRIAERAKLAAQCVNTDVGTLSDSASAIGNVVNLIADIAGQTNLLALNATIEAARAGEFRQGFCYRGGGGQGTGGADRKGNRADRRSDRQCAVRDGKRGRLDRLHRRDHRTGERHCRSHYRGLAAAADGDAGNRPECRSRGNRDPGGQRQYRQRRAGGRPHRAIGHRGAGSGG